MRECQEARRNRQSEESRRIRPLPAGRRMKIPSSRYEARRSTERTILGRFLVGIHPDEARELPFGKLALADLKAPVGHHRGSLQLHTAMPRMYSFDADIPR